MNFPYIPTTEEEWVEGAINCHRLSTIQNADRIYVLQGGEIIQQGKFAELAAESTGLFAKLMARQMV